ncbi:Golgi integral membrane protein 4-like isoform X2 [Hyperolius riggenbachi]|uniref:Golgi integral membrane protein 4-like isoform X2 n=1 Tax=Hyperolius riggenbachi TaxID=752182 RepID=UPI0035A2DA30
MGTGICSRRQKGLLNTGFCLLAVVGLGSGVYLYNYMLNKSRTSEAQALKFKQQHEALSAQLQVVYEHRSRLERSLQKEKGEHKKTKEDYLVYKLEAQEALNKEKQDSMNRFGALGSQHKILKTQNDEMKKQFSDLQVEHSSLKLEHRKSLEQHNQQLSQLLQQKDNEILSLQNTIGKLREESKLLRKAHQDVHNKLLGAQGVKGNVPQVPQKPQENAKNAREGVAQVKKPSIVQPVSPSNIQPRNPLVHTVTLGAGSRNESHVARLTRTVNSLPDRKQDKKGAVSPHAQQPPQLPALHKRVTHVPGAVDKKPPTVTTRAAKEQVPVHSWQNIVSKVNARMTKEEESNRIEVNDAHMKPQNHSANIPAGKGGNKPLQQSYVRPGTDNEAEMDAGMIDRDNGSPPQKQHVGQEALVPEDAADPAKDPNNQGEDEYEEAEIDKPEFEEKVIAEKMPFQPKMENKMLEANQERKSREEPEDHYQDDQEIEERAGELDNGDDLELLQDEGLDKMDTRNRREGYY